MGKKVKKVFSAIPVVGDVVQGLEAEDMGKDAAKQRKAEATEAARRLERTQRANLAEARARTGASGIRLSGSTSKYIEDVSRSYAAELDWIRRSGSSAAQAERRQGELAGMQAYGRAFSNLIGLVSAGQSMGWWGSSTGSGQ